MPCWFYSQRVSMLPCEPRITWTKGLHKLLIEWVWTTVEPGWHREWRLTIYLLLSFLLECFSSQSFVILPSGSSNQQQAGLPGSPTLLPQLSFLLTRCRTQAASALLLSRTLFSPVPSVLWEGCLLDLCCLSSWGGVFPPFCISWSYAYQLGTHSSLKL